jgi:hypothetical protein
MLGPRARQKKVNKYRVQLRQLLKYTDKKATHWHFEFMAARMDQLGLRDTHDRSVYCKGYADAYAEVFHFLSLMEGYPWS